MSQFFQTSSGGGGGAVDSVTGTNGVSASPTTGNVVVSGVNATTSSVGVASFNPLDFSVSGGGQVSSLFNPNQIINEFDDFLSITSQFTSPQGTISVNGTVTNPGIIQIISIPSPIPNGIYLSSSAGNSPIVLGGGTYSMNFVLDPVSLSTLSNTYTLYVGLMEYNDPFFLSTVPTDGCWFQYTDSVNGGDWQVVTSKSSSQTVNNTTTPAATGFHNYGVSVNEAATSVSFTINGVAVTGSPITTNIPTAAIGPAIFCLPSNGNSPGILVDLFYSTQILTTPR